LQDQPVLLSLQFVVLLKKRIKEWLFCIKIPNSTFHYTRRA